MSKSRDRARERSSRVLGFRNLDRRLIDHNGRFRHQVNRSVAGQQRNAPAFHGPHDHAQNGAFQVFLEGADSFLIHERHLERSSSCEFFDQSATLAPGVGSLTRSEVDSSYHS